MSIKGCNILLRHIHKSKLLTVEPQALLGHEQVLWDDFKSLDLQGSRREDLRGVTLRQLATPRDPHRGATLEDNNFGEGAAAALPPYDHRLPFGENLVLQLPPWGSVNKPLLGIKLHQRLPCCISKLTGSCPGLVLRDRQLLAPVVVQELVALE